MRMHFEKSHACGRKNFIDKDHKKKKNLKRIKLQPELETIIESQDEDLSETETEAPT